MIVFPSSHPTPCMPWDSIFFCSSHACCCCPLAVARAGTTVRHYQAQAAAAAEAPTHSLYTNMAIESICVFGSFQLAYQRHVRAAPHLLRAAASSVWCGRCSVSSHAAFSGRIWCALAQDHCAFRLARSHPVSCRDCRCRGPRRAAGRSSSVSSL
jgi:hypothetical protein